MFQKCPVCNGSGMEFNNPSPTSSTSSRCSVCEGAKIISQLNGLPPDLSVKFERNKVLREELEKKIDTAKDKIMYPLTEQEMFKPDNSQSSKFHPQEPEDKKEFKMPLLIAKAIEEGVLSKGDNGELCFGPNFFKTPAGYFSEGNTRDGGDSTEKM